VRTGTVLSPNQDSKRRQIIEAAREVLARDGRCARWQGNIATRTGACTR
jgi:DNA-binding transcriptional regulator YbjK